MQNKTILNAEKQGGEKAGLNRSKGGISFDSS